MVEQSVAQSVVQTVKDALAPSKPRRTVAVVRAEWDAAKARAGATRARVNELGELLRSPTTRPDERQRVRAEYEGLTLRLSVEDGTAHELEIENHRLDTRLRNARETLEVIANPPPWGLGEDLTTRNIEDGKRQAAATIAELG